MAVDLEVPPWGADFDNMTFDEWVQYVQKWDIDWSPLPGEETGEVTTGQEQSPA